MATLTLLGLYSYDSTIFDALTLPEGLVRDDVINSILMECAELEIMYPNPDQLRELVGIWSKGMQYAWSGLLKSTQFEYDPIENYNRNEEWEDSGSAQGSGKNTVAGFNSVEMVDSNGNTTSSSYRSTHKAHLYGNIGVTTSQEMIEEERKVVRFNILDEIAQDFKRKFCVLIY